MLSAQYNGGFLPDIILPSMLSVSHMPARRYCQHAHFIPIVGVGKRGAY